MCLCNCLLAMCVRVPTTHKSVESLELELQMAVKPPYVKACNQTQVPGKSSKCS